MSLSTLFNVDGCIGGREEDWGAIMEGERRHNTKSNGGPVRG